MIFKKKVIVLLLIFLATLTACNDPEVKEINVGFIGPMSTRATDLGIDPSKAMQLAIEQYNSSKSETQPQINLFIEDDKWEKEMAKPAYEKLRKEHNIDVLFISNTDGTIELQDKIIEDGVIAINPLNNDKLLSSLNKNTFKIAKSTEEVHKALGIRMIELGIKKVLILHFPNDFMTIGGNAIKDILTENGIENKIIEIKKDQTNFTEILQTAKETETEAYVFLGYNEFGFAMKQARDLGIEAPFFGSTTLLDPVFFSNSEGAIVGTECTFFTPLDGNYILANEFLESFKKRFGEEPFSIWPPLQAYDAMNILINEVKTINEDKSKDVTQVDWLRNRLLNVKYYQGVCGNISITSDGSSRGIYFSLYKVESDGKLIKIKR